VYPGTVLYPFLYPRLLRQTERAVPHFQLVTTDGDVLGAVELARPDWPVGSIIHRGLEPNLRVVDVIESDDPEQFHVLVVETLTRR